MRLEVELLLCVTQWGSGIVLGAPQFPPRALTQKSSKMGNNTAVLSALG